MIERKGQLIAGGGFQLISDDCLYKYILAPYAIFNEGSTAKSFLARCFVRGGEQWQPTTEQRTYTSPSIFIQDVQRAEGNAFAEALKDLREYGEI